MSPPIKMRRLVLGRLEDPTRRASLRHRRRRRCHCGETPFESVRQKGAQKGTESKLCRAQFRNRQLASATLISSCPPHISREFIANSCSGSSSCSCSSSIQPPPIRIYKCAQFEFSLVDGEAETPTPLELEPAAEDPAPLAADEEAAPEDEEDTADDSATGAATAGEITGAVIMGIWKGGIIIMFEDMTGFVEMLYGVRMVGDCIMDQGELMLGVTLIVGTNFTAGLAAEAAADAPALRFRRPWAVAKTAAPLAFG